VALPERGKYSIFNRSHYENVLVTRVNPEFLLNEHLPGIESVEDVTDEFWETRFQQIRHFEEHITQNGVIVFKFFLHLSKEEQRTRLLRRLEKKDHIWKFAPGDIRERALWDKYQDCCEDAINETSRPHAPWYVIPADDKDFARFLVGKIIYEHMATFTDITEPEPDDDILKDLEHYKALLSKKGG